MTSGKGSDSDGILGGILKIDDRIAELKEVAKENVRTNEEIREMISDFPVNGRGSGANESLGGLSEEEGLLIWPDATTPTQDLHRIEAGSYFGTLLAGVNHFDFEKGTVELGGGVREEELNTSLNEIGADFVRSLSIHADNHITWNIPSESASSFQNQFRKDHIQDTEATELVIQAFSPTNAALFASTQKEIGVNRTGTERSFERVSYSSESEGTVVTVDDSFADNTIDFTTEAEAMRPDAVVGHDIHTMNVGSIGLNVTNHGPEPVELNLQAKNSLFHGAPPWINEDWSDVTGFEYNNPATIPASPEEENSQIFELSPYPHHFIRARARSGTAGTNTDVQMTFLGLTEG